MGDENEEIGDEESTNPVPRDPGLPPTQPPAGQSGFLPPAWADPDDAITTQQDLAGFGWRAGGFLIDMLPLGIIISLATRPLGSILLALLIGGVARVAYGGLLIAYNGGQTIGMKLMKITCVDATTRGAVTPAQALTRAVSAELMASVSAFVGLLAVVQLADMFWPLWDKSNQTLHDKIGKTIVVRPVETFT